MIWFMETKMQDEWIPMSWSDRKSNVEDSMADLNRTHPEYPRRIVAYQRVADFTTSHYDQHGDASGSIPGRL